MYKIQIDGALEVQVSHDRTFVKLICDGIEKVELTVNSLLDSLASVAVQYEMGHSCNIKLPHTDSVHTKASLAGDRLVYVQSRYNCGVDSDNGLECAVVNLHMNTVGQLMDFMRDTMLGNEINQEFTGLSLVK